jgi:hypothetical protein
MASALGNKGGDVGATANPLRFVLSMGLLGGLAMVFIEKTVRGPSIVLAYAAMLIVTALFLRLERVRSFQLRFLVCLGTYVTSSAIVYLFVASQLWKPLTLGAHIWRAAFVLVSGSALSLAIAQLTESYHPTHSRENPLP